MNELSEIVVLWEQVSFLKNIPPLLETDRAPDTRAPEQKFDQRDTIE